MLPSALQGPGEGVGALGLRLLHHAQELGLGEHGIGVEVVREDFPYPGKGSSSQGINIGGNRREAAPKLPGIHDFFRHLLESTLKALATNSRLLRFMTEFLVTCFRLSV